MFIPFSCDISTHVGKQHYSKAEIVQSVSPFLIRPLYLLRHCHHIREVAFGEREK